jgi:Flp pilus assembly protein TadG
MKKRWPFRGQSLVEFALTIPIFLLIILAFIDLGRGLYYYSALNNAVREGARHASINLFNDSSERQAVIEQIVQDFAVASPVQPGSVIVYCERDTSKHNINPCTQYVTVTAQVQFEPVTFFLAQVFGQNSAIAINSQSTMQMTPYGRQK